MARLDEHVTGFREIDLALQKLPSNVAKTALNQALTKSARPMLKTAKSLAMAFRNPGIYQTGELAKSLKIGTRLTRRQKRLAARLPGTAVIYLGASWPKGAHAHLKEFGTSKMPAEPFLRPAWDQHRSQFLDTFQREIWITMQKAVNRLAKRAFGSRR